MPRCKGPRLLLRQAHVALGRAAQLRLLQMGRLYPGDVAMNLSPMGDTPGSTRRKEPVKKDKTKRPDGINLPARMIAEAR